MTNSQNGWPIKPGNRSPLVVAGVNFGDVLDGDVHTVLEYVASRYDHEVEKLIRGTCGAYNPRQIPGSNTWSNHASATAIDCNWARHPLGARGTYTAPQRAAINRIIADCDGVVRWGGVYTTTVDEMHFEINKGAAAVKALAEKIRNQEDDMATLTEAQLQEAIVKLYATAANATDTNATNDTQVGRNFRTSLDKIDDFASKAGPLTDAVTAVAGQLAELKTQIAALAAKVDDLAL